MTFKKERGKEREKPIAMFFYPQNLANQGFSEAGQRRSSIKDYNVFARESRKSDMLSLVQGGEKTAQDNPHMSQSESCDLDRERRSRSGERISRSPLDSAASGGGELCFTTGLRDLDLESALSSAIFRGLCDGLWASPLRDRLRLLRSRWLPS